MTQVKRGGRLVAHGKVDQALHVAHLLAQERTALIVGDNGRQEAGGEKIEIAQRGIANELGATAQDVDKHGDGRGRQLPRGHLLVFAWLLIIIVEEVFNELVARVLHELVARADERG